METRGDNTEKVIGTFRNQRMNENSDSIKTYNALTS